jgi:secreted trypsin-like serine protease
MKLGAGLKLIARRWHARRAHLTAVAAAALCLPSMAFAIVGGAGVDANSNASPWLGVGSLTVGGGVVSGTLIAPNYVLTAAHGVIGGAGNPASVTFQINGDSTTQLVADQIFFNPAYTGIAAADGIVRNDLAIVHLASPAPADVPFYSLYSSAITTGTRLYMAGYGAGGDGFGGTTPGPDAAVKRSGQNIADVLLPYGSVHDSYVFDFDGPDNTSNLFGGGTLGANVEATLGAGDSGSPAFVLDHGVYKLAGVNTFVGSCCGGANAPLFGSIGGGLLISAQTEWINSVINPVPEPQVWLMLLPGLLGIGALQRCRRKG